MLVDVGIATYFRVNPNSRLAPSSLEEDLTVSVRFLTDRFQHHKNHYYNYNSCCDLSREARKGRGMETGRGGG